MSQLKELFESSVLNDETKQVLQEAWNKQIEAEKIQLESEKKEAIEESRKEMAKLIPQMVEEALAEEMEEIAEEVRESRNLEVTYAEKLQNFKESYSETMNEQMQQLVAESVAEEFDELKEDIEMAKQHQFALKLTEAFGQVYNEMFNQDDFDVAVKLKETEAQLESYQRKEKMSELLESVSGEKRKVCETILEGVSVDKMEAKFESIKPIIMKESASDERVDESDDGKTLQESEDPKGTVVLENEDQPEDEPVKESKDFDAINRSLRFLGRDNVSR